MLEGGGTGRKYGHGCRNTEEAMAQEKGNEWGYEAVNSVQERPEKSWERIKEQIRLFYPDAEEKEIRKVMAR